MRRRVPGRALGALLAMVASCGGGGDGDMDRDPVDPEPVLDGGVTAPPRACDGVEAQIGSGVRAFEPVKDGDTLPLFRGPQGGYMIYLSVRAKGLDPSYVVLHYEETFVDDGELFGVGDWKIQLTNDVGDGWFERVGIWGEIEPELWTKPSSVRGRDAIMKVTLTDLEGCSVGPLGWTIHIDEEPPR